MDFTHEQYLAALGALGLDPETTESINLARAGDGFWIRVVYTDKPVTSGPVEMPDPVEDEPTSLEP
ncbi:TPA: hypothetical protein OQU49_004423 [Shigella flexneri]|nr:hypothetical protein [Shigella flexneri]